MRKTILLLILTALTGLATAVIASPGETTVLDDNITQNSSESPEIVSSQLPSNINLSVEDGNLTASPSYDLYPDNYSGEVEFSNGYNQSYTVEVPEVFNWSAQPQVLNDTISVGSSGQINTTEIDLRSNVDPEFNGEITGNISEYFSVDRFQFEETGRYTVLIGYGVNENTQFGNYTGQLVIEGNQGTNQTVNLSYEFKDEISPQITDVNVDDIMSTREEDFSVIASDNLNISEVSANITRIAEKEENNETVEYNQTVGSYVFEPKDDTNLFQLNFQDTEEISTYYSNISVEDGAGNAVSRVVRFEVEGLDAVNILNSNFVFEAVNPTTSTDQDSKAKTEFLEITESTPVTLTLDQLTHGNENSTLPEGVSVLKEGESAGTSFQGEDGTVEIEDEGTYYLVAESNKIESYHGEIAVDVVPQHVEIPDRIVFDGQIKDPVYPDCNNMSIGEFNGRICFADPDKAEQDTIEFQATAPAEDCKGVDSWNQCLTGYSLGEIPEIESQAKSDRFWRNIAIAVAVFIGLLELGARAKENLEDQIMIQTYKS